MGEQACCCPAGRPSIRQVLACLVCLFKLCLNCQSELIVKCLNCLSKLTTWTDSEISELADWIDHVNWLSKLTDHLFVHRHHWLFLEADDQDVVDSTAPQHGKTRLLTFKKVVKHWKAASSTTSGSTGGKGCGQVSCSRCREVNSYQKHIWKHYLSSYM